MNADHEIFKSGAAGKVSVVTIKVNLEIPLSRVSISGGWNVLSLFILLMKGVGRFRKERSNVSVAAYGVDM